MRFDLRNLPAPDDGAAPASLNLTPVLLLKISASMAMMAMGFYSLSRGREMGSIQRMMLGAALLLSALLVF